MRTGPPLEHPIPILAGLWPETVFGGRAGDGAKWVCLFPGTLNISLWRSLAPVSRARSQSPDQVAANQPAPGAAAEDEARGRPGTSCGGRTGAGAEQAELRAPSEPAPEPRRRHGPERPDGHGRGLRRPVPARHQAVPAARGAALPHQHLPGGWSAHVVPVGGAAGLHRQHLGLRLPASLFLRLPQPSRAADWLCPGAEQEPRAVRLLRALRDHSPTDNRLQHLVGLEVPDEEPGPGRRTAAAPGRVAVGREEHVCRCPDHAGELPETVHAAGGQGPAGPHVHDPASLRRQLLFYSAEHRGHGADGPGSHRLQDQAGGTHTGRVALRHQRVLQRLLDHPCVQAHARLPQVRLLPDHVRHRGPAPGGGPGPWGCLHGREEEGVVMALGTSAVPLPTPSSVKAQVFGELFICRHLKTNGRPCRARSHHCIHVLHTGQVLASVPAQAGHLGWWWPLSGFCVGVSLLGWVGGREGGRLRAAVL